MLQLQGVDHIAVIASDYARSLDFYTQVLGMEVLSEEYRAERGSMMTRLGLNGTYLMELFTFPDPPARLSYPEACGLRHLAFTVEDMDAVVRLLDSINVPHEPVRLLPDGGRSCFLYDPDDLPIELVQNKR